MMNIYARNINAIPPDQTPPSGEVLLWTIPMAQGSDSPPFLNASVNNELGKAETFEFSVDPTSKYADIWRQMRTVVRVEYDGTNIFYGRVLTIDRDMFRTRKIHCEGAYSFFIDSVYEMKTSGSKITIGEFIDELLSAHNTCMAECPEKQIFAGEIPGHYSSSVTTVQQVKNDSQKFTVGSGYKTVKDLLDELASDYSGHMRVRYNNSDNKLYLDWMQTYFNKDVSNQTMSVSSNAVDLSDTMEVNNIFTHVIVVGKGYGYSDGSRGGRRAKHKVTVEVNRKDYGSAYADKEDPKEGEVVHLTAVPHHSVYPNGSSGQKVNFAFDHWEVVSGGVSISNNSFVMGSNTVTVKAFFTSDGGAYGNAKSITINNYPRTYGSVSASKSAAVPGETIYLSHNAYKGHKFTRWVVNGGGVSVSGNSFRMGAEPVSITGLFDIDIQ